MDSERSEYQKMLDGDWYNANDPSMKRKKIDDAVYEFNHTRPSNIKKRLKLMANFFVNKPNDVWILSDFYVEFGLIEMGDHVFVNTGCKFVDGAGIKIGNNVLIAPCVKIITTVHPESPQLRPSNLVKGKKIVIEDGVWIGAGATILGGVKIGKNSIVGAGCIVSKDVPENSVVISKQNIVCRDLRKDLNPEDFKDLLETGKNTFI